MQWDIYVWHIIVQQSSNERWRIHFSLIFTESHKFVNFFLCIPYFYWFFIPTFSLTKQLKISQFSFILIFYSKYSQNIYKCISWSNIKKISFFFFFFLFLGCVIFNISKITSPFTTMHSISGKPDNFPF